MDSLRSFFPCLGKKQTIPIVEAPEESPSADLHPAQPQTVPSTPEPEIASEPASEVAFPGPTSPEPEKKALVFEAQVETDQTSNNTENIGKF